jgi:maltose alpha-D-glucosyltransferase/alpha-amylase
MVKVYRRLRAGEQPEIEMAQFLTETAGFRNTPAYYGSAFFTPAEGEPVTLAAAFAFVRNQGDAWGAIAEALGRDLEAAALQPAEAAPFAFPLNLGKVLGKRTAELHVALATPTKDRRFAVTPVEAADLKHWASAATRELASASKLASGAVKSRGDSAKAEAVALHKAQAALARRISAAAGLKDAGLKTRIHGDYHLGQVLLAQDDVMLIDFEGEPLRGIGTRRQKMSPLRDVAGMVRSFDYAAWAAIGKIAERDGAIDEALRARALAWRDTITRDFLKAYWPIVADAGLVPQHAASRRSLLDLFIIEKAAYEVAYEAANRPTWLPIPIQGLLALAAGEGSGT